MFTVLFECQMIAQVIQVQQNSPYIHIATTALKIIKYLQPFTLHCRDIRPSEKLILTNQT